MKYSFYYVKLGPSNLLADYWLQRNGKKNVFGAPCLVLYFNKQSVAELREKNTHFGKVCGELEDKANPKVYFLTYTSDYHLILTEAVPGAIWDVIDDEEKFNEYVQATDIIDNNRIPDDYKNNANTTLKVLKVTPVKDKKGNEANQFRLIDIPHIIATLNSSQKYNRNTITHISDCASVAALTHILNAQEKQKPKQCSDNRDFILSCLSPYELETLVFMIFYHHHWFVPAWRGGTMKGIDIMIRWKVGAHPKIGGVLFENECYYFQVKSMAKEFESNDNEELWNVGLFPQSKPTEKTLGADWLWSCIKGTPQVQEWLKNTLYWLHEECFTSAGI